MKPTRSLRPLRQAGGASRLHPVSQDILTTDSTAMRMCAAGGHAVSFSTSSARCAAVPGTTASTIARRRARCRSSSGMERPSCACPVSPRATSPRGRRGLSRPDGEAADAGSRPPHGHGRGRRAHRCRRHGSRAASRSRSSATTTSTCGSGGAAARFLRAGGLDPIIHIRTACSKAMAPTSRRCRASPQRGRDCWSRSIAAPPATSRSRAARRLGLDVVVIDHHLADERLPPAWRW